MKNFILIGMIVVACLFLFLDSPASAQCPGGVCPRAVPAYEAPAIFHKQITKERTVIQSPATAVAEPTASSCAKCTKGIIRGARGRLGEVLKNVRERRQERREARRARRE